MQVTNEQIIYPSSDGQPIADSTTQFDLMVKIQEGCESLFKKDPNVFVAADLLWYPVEGRNDIFQAPDLELVEQIELNRQRRQQAAQRAEQESQRAERLAAKLRELNIDPDRI
ncbi:hypothetical protein IQ269_16060 [Tychonema sp. LEGE 07199]|uniref:hypothetical protein n=1 Tax=unclassified Tychonema TaxID=2642144 RepID=UPI0018821604|nr:MULTISPECIES: hypothetical protein [unclassified Tychonema]MBE9122276.1 hypothetical protein [Tychonema sp. LEGE 07199]MBE9130489.1 hypothetical protein [Tychonema sp. LEGE 07196]